MIRLTTMIWLGMAAILIAGLFHLKYTVSDQEKELARIKRETAQIQVQTQALYAEWNRLNRPDRLRRLLRQRAALTPMAGGQLRNFAELPSTIDSEQLASRGYRPAPRDPATDNPNRRERRLITNRRSRLKLASKVRPRTKLRQRAKRRAGKRYGRQLARRVAAPPGRRTRYR